MNNSRLTNLVTQVVVITLVIALLILLIPWKFANWGTVNIGSTHSITVQGKATSQEQNQIARFTAGVTAINSDKQAATQEVNQKIIDIIAAVKSFGIADQDIQTQSISVFQMEEPYGEPGRQITRQGQWRASNDIQITLRDLNKASELAGLLTGSGATNVYGPNFMIEDLGQAEIDLLNQAIENGRQKAQALAEYQGQKLGKIITLVEDGSVSPIFNKGMADGLASGMGGAAIEPGSATVTKSVSVTFELR